jgi:hypothetical protein
VWNLRVALGDPEMMAGGLNPEREAEHAIPVPPGPEGGQGNQGTALHIIPVVSEVKARHAIKKLMLCLNKFCVIC